MIKKNGEEKVYLLLDSHLISKKAVKILLREEFNKADYYEFIEERKNTIIKAIEELIFNKRKEENMDYLKLIENKENDKLEFKSTFYYDINEEKSNKARKLDVIKAITGFLNTSGGTLMVGVADDGGIFGLEKDYEICFRKDQDGFLQNFRSTLDSFFDDGTIRRHISYRIVYLNGKDVLIVDVEKSREAIFLKKDQEKIIYIRRGNKTDNLTDSEEIHKYIKDNWKI